MTLLDFAKRVDYGRSIYRIRGLRGAKFYVLNIYPRFQPNPEHDEQYEGWCYAKRLLHHPFCDSPEQPWRSQLKGGHPSWAEAYKQLCVERNCVHNDDDTLPVPSNHDADVQEEAEEDFDDDDDNNANEVEALRFIAAWQHEAGRAPNAPVNIQMDDLGRRDRDNYDWVLNSPQNVMVNDARDFLARCVRGAVVSDVDGTYVPANVDWTTLKGKQRKVFLQVLAYFKGINSGGAMPLDPLRLNVDGTAGTGKSWLIWSITKALGELFALGNGVDPVARVAPTGIAAYGV